MNNTFVVHVFEGIEELCDEKPARVFAHRSHRLAKIKEETARHMLHHDVHQVVDMATRWLYDLARVPVAQHLHYIPLVHVLENRDFIVN